METKYYYKTKDGKYAYMIKRKDTAKGKKITQHTVSESGEVTESKLPQQYAIHGSRPLYNLPTLTTKPKILLVEGEKAADAASQYLPDAGWFVTTWSGGVNGVKFADWTSLKGKQVVLWPDNDDPGRVAMNKINNSYLGPLGIKAYVVKDLSAYPEKWDLADPLPEGITKESIITMIGLCVNECAVATPVEVPVPDRFVKSNVTHIFGDAPKDNYVEVLDINPDPHNHCTALGYNGSELFFMTKDRQEPVDTTVQKLCRLENLLALHSDPYYWNTIVWDAFRSQDPVYAQKKVDYTVIASALARQCYKKGLYSAKKIRGIGVWKDGKSYVLHLGDKLVTSSAMKIGHTERVTKYIYPIKEDTIPFKEDTTPLTNEQGGLIVKACTYIGWSNPLFADLFAGWLALAPICGVLDWRPHIWITGNSGSGKTQLTKFFDELVGDLCIYLEGNSTESGIRNDIRSDSRPVCFDEFESKDKRRQEMAQNIIEYLRSSSSEKKGEIKKGQSGGGGSVAFKTRCMFCLLSIGDNLRDKEDKERITIMSLRSEASYASADLRLQQFKKFCDTRAKISEIKDVTSALLKRMLKDLDFVRENVRIFCAAAGEVFSSARHGDQFGTMLAGKYLLENDKMATREYALDVIKSYQWDSVMDNSRSIPEDEEVIKRIMSANIRCEGVNMKSTTLKVAELIRQSGGEMQKNHSIPLGSDEAKAILERNGISVGQENIHLAISKFGYISDLLRDTPFANSWPNVITRNNSVISPRGDKLFSGVPFRYITIPIECLNG